MVRRYKYAGLAAVGLSAILAIGTAAYIHTTQDTGNSYSSAQGWLSEAEKLLSETKTQNKPRIFKTPFGEMVNYAGYNQIAPSQQPLFDAYLKYRENPNNQDLDKLIFDYELKSGVVQESKTLSD